MSDIEIPLEQDRHGWYRFFEILPGALSWTMLALPFIISVFDVNLAAFLILIYLIVLFARALAGGFRVFQGYRQMRTHQKLDWQQLVDELEVKKVSGKNQPLTWHKVNVERYKAKQQPIKPSDVLHAVIIATVNESREILEPTIQSILASNYDANKIILVIAYEGRAGKVTKGRVLSLLEDYKHNFRHAMAVEHPADIPNEVIGKGGNVTFAGKRLNEYLQQQKIDPINVIVTTLDADNRPDPQYFPALTYLYCLCPDPVRVSIQPVSMYTNNIWDAPAPMRVMATGNSFFNIVLSFRPHALRNFSSHAQGMQSLLQTNFWSTRTIVEDGHQFWRSYFAFDGDYRVLPLYIPIYQDAVLTDSYKKTLKAQFIQLRRWTYGASDIAYLITKGVNNKKIPKLDWLGKVGRLLENHVSWAVAPLLTLFAGFIPALFHPNSFAANELPLVVSRVQDVALIGAFASLYICLRTLPPRPARYRRHRTFFMILQWIYLPVTGIAYNSLAALYSQTRLMLGKYIGKFDVTEKAVVKESGEVKTTKADTI